MMGQNIKQGLILKMRNYWSVGAGSPTEKLWMGDAGGDPVLRLGVLIPAIPKHPLLFKMSLQELETKMT